MAETCVFLSLFVWLVEGFILMACKKKNLCQVSKLRELSICQKAPFQLHNIHGSYNLEKVLNFSSHLEKSLNSVKILEKYLISLFGLEKSLKFSNLLMPYHFSEKLNDFAEKKLCIDDE